MTTHATRVVAVAVLLGGCGYTLSARPPLPGGLTAVSVQLFENDTPELEVGTLMTSALARRIEADGRLSSGSGANGKVVGRIEIVRAAPVAFPAGAAGAGMYELSLQVRVRMIASDGGTLLAEVLVQGREQFLAGQGPERTEALRRLALGRLSERLADEAWTSLLVR